MKEVYGNFPSYFVLTVTLRPMLRIQLEEVKIESKITIL